MCCSISEAISVDHLWKWFLPIYLKLTWVSIRIKYFKFVSLRIKLKIKYLRTRFQTVTSLLAGISWIKRLVSKIQIFPPSPFSVLGLVPDHILQLITEREITQEYIRTGISEVTTEAIEGPIISEGATEAFIRGASITEVAMETTAQIGRITGKHTVLVGAAPAPGPQREGPLHQDPGAILETPISLPLTGQGAPRPLVLPPTTAEWNLLSASLQRRKSPLPRIAGHLRPPGITKETRPRNRRSLEAPLKIQKRLIARNHGQMPPHTVLVLHHGPPQFLSWAPGSEALLSKAHSSLWWWGGAHPVLALCQNLALHFPTHPRWAQLCRVVLGTRLGHTRVHSIMALGPWVHPKRALSVRVLRPLAPHMARLRRRRLLLQEERPIQRGKYLVSSPRLYFYLTSRQFNCNVISELWLMVIR